MSSQEAFRRESGAPVGKVEEFFFWLRGLWAPKYVPIKSRHGTGKGKMANEKSESNTLHLKSGKQYWGMF